MTERTILSANSSEFLDSLYKSLETHPIVINACMSRMCGCDNDVFVQNASELDTLRKDKVYVWRPQNRLIVCKTPKVLFSGTATFKELIQKGFSRDCLTGFGQRPVTLIYLEELEDLEEREHLDDAGLPLVYHYVIEEIKWHTMKDVAYVPLENGDLVRGAY